MLSKLVVGWRGDGSVAVTEGTRLAQRGAGRFAAGVPDLDDELRVIGWDEESSNPEEGGRRVLLAILPGEEEKTPPVEGVRR
jgi:hypothetical protein